MAAPSRTLFQSNGQFVEQPPAMEILEEILNENPALLHEYDIDGESLATKWGTANADSAHLIMWLLKNGVSTGQTKRKRNYSDFLVLVIERSMNAVDGDLWVEIAMYILTGQIKTEYSSVSGRVLCAVIRSRNHRLIEAAFNSEFSMPWGNELYMSNDIVPYAVLHGVHTEVLRALIIGGHCQCPVDAWIMSICIVAHSDERGFTGDRLFDIKISCLVRAAMAWAEQNCDHDAFLAAFEHLWTRKVFRRCKILDDESWDPVKKVAHLLVEWTPETHWLMISPKFGDAVETLMVLWSRGLTREAQPVSGAEPMAELAAGPVTSGLPDGGGFSSLPLELIFEITKFLTPASFELEK